MKFAIYSLLLLAAVVPQVVSADSVLRVGSDVSVTADQVVEGNYYAATRPFDSVTMSGTVTGDMYVAGGTVTINGEIQEDLFILGGVSNVHATVTEDVRIVGGEVTIGEYVGGDLFVLGGTLNVLSSATVDGTIFFFGGNGDIAGTVAGSLVGYAERLQVDGTIGGDIDMKVPAGLQLGSAADITGSISYQSFVDIARDPASVVGGEITRTTAEPVTGKEAARAVLTPIFIILFTALSVYLFFRRQLLAMVQTTITRPLRSTLVGTGVVIASPLVAMMLMVTILGFVVGAVVFLSATVLMLMGVVLAGSLLGSYLWYWYKQEIQVSLLTIIGGTSVLYICLLIPIIGVLAYILLAVQVVGAMGVRLYSAVK